MCIHVCAGVHEWKMASSIGLQSQEAETNVSVQLAPFFLFSPGPFHGWFQSHPEGVFFLHLKSPGNNTLRHSQASFYDDLRLSLVESED